MGQPDGRIGRIDRLAAGTRSAENILSDIVHIDLQIELLGLGQHGYRSGRRVHAALRLGLRHALHAVHARFVLQHAVDALARNLHHDFLEASGRAFVCAVDLVLPTALFYVFDVHAQQVAGEQGGLVASRAAADLDDRVLAVLRIGGNQQQFDPFLERGELGLEFEHFGTGHFAQLVVFLRSEDLLRLGEMVQCRAVFLARFDYRLKLLILLVEGDEFLHVGNHFGIGHLLTDLLVLYLQPVETGKHRIFWHRKRGLIVSRPRRIVRPRRRNRRLRDHKGNRFFDFSYLARHARTT